MQTKSGEEKKTEPYLINSDKDSTYQYIRRRLKKIIFTISIDPLVKDLYLQMYIFIGIVGITVQLLFLKKHYDSIPHLIPILNQNLFGRDSLLSTDSLIIYIVQTIFLLLSGIFVYREIRMYDIKYARFVLLSLGIGIYFTTYFILEIIRNYV